MTAETLRIDHPTASYGIFCFNSIGDLFLSSDWGFYAYNWRSFNGTFKEFLGSTNSDYIIGKFQIVYSEMTGKKIPKHKVENLKILIDEFIKFCKDGTS